MKSTSISRLAALSLLLPWLVRGQPIMVYDQQSSDESNGGSGGTTIQNFQPLGQSFTPSLNGVGFVRLNLFDENQNNGQGATTYVNLRSDSITGPIIGSTAPVNLPDNFGLPLNTGYVTFFFPSEVALQLGTMYFLQPVVQSGDSWGIFNGPFGYSRGDFYANGTAFSIDAWFREGVIVPEPSTSALSVMAVGVALYLRTRKS